MSQNESLEAVKRLVDVETDNQNKKITDYLKESVEYLKDQKTLLGLDPSQQPTDRERTLIEKLAGGIYTTWNRPEHSIQTETNAKTDIKTHLRSVAQKQTEDGTAIGSNQFRKSDGNVREDHGL